MKKLIILFLLLASFFANGQGTNVFKYLELKNVDTIGLTKVGQFWYNPTVGKFTFHDGSGYRHFGTVLTNGQGTTANGSAADLGGTISSLRTINFGTNGLIVQSTGSGGTTTSNFTVANQSATPFINLSTNNGAFGSNAYSSAIVLQSNSSSSLVRLRAYNSGGSGAQQIILSDAGIQMDVLSGVDAPGDLLVRGSSGRLQPIAAVATGNALISNGVGNVMGYGKIGLTTHVSGNLPLANGGLETSLSAPASSKILGYDITDATNGYWTIGSNLSYDHASHTLSAAGGSGGGVSGLTTNRMPYAANSTTLIDDAAMTWDATNKVPTFNNARLVSNGTNGIKGFYLGYQAGNFTSVTVSNGGNTGFGYQVFSSITDGVASFDATANTAFGYQALKANTNASNLTAFGYKALAAETSSGGGSSGWNQTAIGANALAAANGGYQNVAIGDGVMKIATTPSLNVVIGSDAGSGCTTCGQNVMIGDNAGNGIAGGSQNVIIGSEAGEFVNSGANIYIGYIAGVYATTGQFNTVVGTNAGGYSLGVDHSLTTGGWNTFIGGNAGNAVATTQFDYTTALGFNSVVSANRMMAFGDNGANRPNYGFGGASFGGGFGVMYLANYSTVPTSAPTGGSFFYSDAGIMKLWNAGAGAGVVIAAGITFPLSSSQLTINNPAGTFAYTFTSQAIGGARTITLPLLAASDEMVTKDFTQTLSNKSVATESALSANLKIANTKYVDDAITAAGMPAFSTTVAGYVNLSGAVGSLLKHDNTWLTIGANNTVLTSNGTTFSWAAPSNSGTVTSVSGVSANGFSWSVATATTTPAITLSVTTQSEFDNSTKAATTAYFDRIGSGFTNRQTASYTLVIGDAGKIIEQNVAGANNLTVPTNASVAFVVKDATHRGTEILVSNYGVGQTTIVAAGGVTIRAANGLKLRAQYSVCTLIKIGTDEWIISGDTTP